MTFEQLDCLIAAAEEPTFFDAAESLHITQSSLSKQIMKLERELGIKLLDRSRRKAVLTEAGEEFYKEALALHRQYRRMLGKMQNYKDTLENEIRIGTLPILMQYHLDQRIKTFSETHSDIHIVLDEAEEELLLKRLDENTYHFIISREQLVKNGRYQYKPLAEDELVAVLPSGHPIAASYTACARPLSLTDLSNEHFILMHPYTSVYQQCMEALQKQNMDIRVIRTARAESILSAVSIGEGVSLIPKSNLHVFLHENITAIPLTPPITLSVVLAGKKGHMPTDAMRTFMECF